MAGPVPWKGTRVLTTLLDGMIRFGAAAAALVEDGVAIATLPERVPLSASVLSLCSSTEPRSFDRSTIEPFDDVPVCDAPHDHQFLDAVAIVPVGSPRTAVVLYFAGPRPSPQEMLSIEMWAAFSVQPLVAPYSLGIRSRLNGEVVR